MDSQKKTIIIISTSSFNSGAEQSLYDLISKTNDKIRYIYTCPKECSSSKNDVPCDSIYIPYKWLRKTINPVILLRFTASIIISTIKLYSIIKCNNIHFIYANTYKSLLYGLIVSKITNTKLVCHVRDNVESGILKKILMVGTDKLICISKHIHGQFPSKVNDIQLIYGGIDVTKWIKSQSDSKLTKVNFSTNTSHHMLIACIGQVTRWKNQEDFIKLAGIIANRFDGVQFLIVGDDQSGREQRYKNELLELINEKGLQNKIDLIGHREEITEITSQIDILVHPAINEPFGRILVEAMALEKPVVAYHCGGPVEIIIDGVTGYLVEPDNFHELANKTIDLIKNKELRIKMGKAGRKRVIKKFNLERYIQEMGEVFNHL